MATKKTTSSGKKEKTATSKKSQHAANWKAHQVVLAPKKANLPKTDKTADFPIIGIGASAGGLEAFEQFFNNMPPDCGMGFVLVQHLDPTHKSILTDLIRSFTRMSVTEVRDGMKVELNNIYVIPPNFDMAILHGVLHLIEPSAPRGLRQPIDFFFRSLSEDRKERAICVVLSGSGTEGTLGLREIKGQGGMVMVQDPSSAKYDGMPRSAIGTGLVDYVLPPDKMPDQLIAYVQHPFTKGPGKAPEVEPDATSSLQKILIMIRSKTGHDFSYYKQSTIIRRIERRMAIHEVDNLSNYLRYLQKYQDEVDTLFKELLIGVTNFFRDKEAFEHLSRKVIPSLCKEKPDENGGVRVWVPGCSTGEEAYSLGILFQEHIEETQRELKVQIFATDIDSAAIETARAGLYPHGIAVDVEGDRLRRFFSKQDGSYRVKKSVRDMVVFALQNVITDPPFSKIDLISCRNLLIYMGSELQRRILPVFHYSLSKGGYLFLGTSETVGEFSDLFSPVDRKWKMFRRRDAEPVGAIPLEVIHHTMPVVAPPLAVEPKGPKFIVRLSNQELVERALLDSYGASGVLINEKGDVLYFHGSTSKYLAPPEGEAHFNVLAMAREDLKLELANIIRKGYTGRKPVRQENIRIDSGADGWVNLIIVPILEPPSRRGLFMVVFEEVKSKQEDSCAAPPADADVKGSALRVRELEHQLASTKEYLQTTIEELETSNEELKSTNEELQSANEELQSTNEELETSKEEQQSVNEELVTVNSELQQKIDALSKLNDDMTNLLAATQIGTIFLDTRLNIMRFTPAAKKIVNLIDGDVGRPIGDIVHNLEYEGLVEDAGEVLRTLKSKDIEVRMKSGNWYSMRLHPYRTTQNVIEGAVVTFIDISDRKRAEIELQASERRYKGIGELFAGVWTCDPDGKMTYLSQSFLEMLGLTLDDCDGHKWIEKMQIKTVRQLRDQWKNCIENNGTWNHRFSIRDKSGKEKAILTRGVPVKNDEGEVTSWVGINLDMDDAANSVEPCSPGPTKKKK